MLISEAPKVSIYHYNLILFLRFWKSKIVNLFISLYMKSVLNVLFSIIKVYIPPDFLFDTENTFYVNLFLLSC